MNWRIISTLVKKDISLFFKNQFFALITVLGLVAYIVIYFVMPSEVDETLEIGFFSPIDATFMVEVLEEEDILVIERNSVEDLKKGLRNNDYDVGVALSNRFNEQIRQQDEAELTIYFTSEFPVEFQDAYVILFQEMGFIMTGQELNVDAIEEIIGPDMVGDQIPDRERMLPLFAVFMLMMETLGLASLITSELENGTIQALLITPTNIGGLFISKGIVGVGLAFVEAVILMLATGGLSENPVLIMVALFIGALLVTGIGFLIASVAKDMMSVMGWGMLALLTLAIPAMGVLLPGTVSGWAKIVPSYYLVDTVHRVSNFGASWGDMSQNLLMLSAFALVFLILGVLVLNRRQQQAFA